MGWQLQRLPTHCYFQLKQKAQYVQIIWLFVQKNVYLQKLFVH